MLVPKYKIGQEVYVVSSTHDSKRVHRQCDVCNSTGKVKIQGSDEKYICPYCHGLMDTEHYGYKYVIAYYGAKIGKIVTEEYAKKYKKHKSRITYMLEETGVGSGTIWNENRLFSTEDEAKEFCEKYIPSDEYDHEAILREK